MLRKEGTKNSNNIMYQSIESIPMIPILEEDQLALSLTWTNTQFDLDLSVEFDLGPDIKCRVNHAYRECGGVRLIMDNSMVA